MGYGSGNYNYGGGGGGGGYGSYGGYGYGGYGYGYGYGYSGNQQQQQQDQQAGQSQDAFAVPGQGWSTDALNSFAQAGFDPSMVTGSPATEGMTPNEVVGTVFNQMDAPAQPKSEILASSAADVPDNRFNLASPGTTGPGGGTGPGPGNQGTGGGRFTDTGNFVSGPSGGSYGNYSTHGSSTDLQTLVNQFLSNPGNYGPVSPVPGQGWRMPQPSASSLSSLASSVAPSASNTASTATPGNYSMAARPIPGVGWR